MLPSLGASLVSNHTACRFAEKSGFSVHFGPGGAGLLCLPFSKVKRFIARLYPLFMERIPRDGGLMESGRAAALFDPPE